LSRRSPLSGKYLLQNTLAKLLIKGIDFLLSFLPRKKTVIPSSPQRILIANLAHMGDVVMMSSMLPHLKTKFPKSEIGVLIGSWSLSLMKNHPYVDHVHIVDHWKLNRAPIPFFKKFFHYYQTFFRAVKEIRNSYDIAIDSYFFFPNAIPIFWKAKIPVRIGYTSGGFGDLLTHAVEWKNLVQPLTHYYIPLLKFLNISPSHDDSCMRPYLPQPQTSQIHTRVGKPSDVARQAYIVVHIGTGSTLKEWPLSKWRELVKKINTYPLYFTGKGAHENKLITNIIDQIEGCINMADQLNWEEYTALLKGASLMIGVDSLAGHLAAVFDTPSVLIYSGMSNLDHWKPLNKKCTVLTKSLPCSPCYRGKGCSAMTCIRDVDVESVYQACKQTLTDL